MTDEFLRLAEMLRDIIVEQDLPNTEAEIPDSIVLGIASDLSKDFEAGTLIQNADGTFYYVGMCEDYCGKIYEILEGDCE
jgi:hypothetical protein